MLPVNDEITSQYFRTGADDYQGTDSHGTVGVRSFLKSKLRFSGDPADRQIVYSPTLWAVWEHCEYQIDGKVWMVTTERLRTDSTQIRHMLQISTDGLIGRAFGAPVELAAAAGTNHTWHQAPITDKDGVTWIYLSSPSPSGLYRWQVDKANGLLINYERRSTQAQSEGCILQVDKAAGKLINVFRVDAGDYLRQQTSSDNGATWTASVSTGLGSTGVKVQPRIIEDADGNVAVAFMDRGGGNYDYISLGTTKANAFANVYRAVKAISLTTTNGNGDLFVLDKAKGLYLYTCISTSAANAPNNSYYWVLKISKNTRPQPYV